MRATIGCRAVGEDESRPGRLAGWSYDRRHHATERRLVRSQRPRDARDRGGSGKIERRPEHRRGLQLSPQQVAGPGDIHAPVPTGWLRNRRGGHARGRTKNAIVEYWHATPTITSA